MVKLLNEKKHEDQKKRFVAQARKLFATHGVMETSMSRIARACKVTKAGLYHYFQSKDEIVKEIFLTHVEQKDQIIASLQRANTLEETLYLLGKNHLLEMKRPDHVELLKILLSETMKTSEMRKFYDHFIMEQIGFIVQDVILPKVNPSKPPKQVKLLFFQFFASLMHYSWHRMMVGDLTPLIGDEENYVRILAKTYAGRFLEV
jgi:AcrR family transcriptional regulator